MKTVMADLRPFFLVGAAKLMQKAKEGGLVPDDETILKPLTIKKPPSDSPTPSERQNYSVEVFTYLSNILAAVERIGAIRIYLSRLPQPRKYDALGITEDQWITYHYSNFMVAVVSLYDTSLLL